MKISYSLRKSIESILKREKGAIRNVFGTAVSVGLCFPNTYRLGSSNLGFHFLYDRINKTDEFLAERFFADIMPPFSMESQKPLNQFDIIMFSVPYELDFAEVVRFLKEAGIPVFRKDRTISDPLVVAGGQAITMNPVALFDVLDISVLGDGEPTLGLLLEKYLESNGDKTELVSSLKNSPGFFILADEPGQIMKRAVCRNLDEHPLSSVYLTPDAEFANSCLVEISRGCPHGCRFCYVGHNQNPFRKRSLESIQKIVKQKMSLTKRFGFISSDVAAHPEIRELCNWCMQQGLNVSFSSLRAEEIPSALFTLLRKSGQNTITLAPETGSDSLRDAIKKRLTNEKIISCVEEALSHGFYNIKLYFMLGLPGEDQRDIEASVGLIKIIREKLVSQGRKRKKIGELIVSVSFFVPKPKTPLGNSPFLNPPELKKRQKYFMEALGGLAHVRFLPANPFEAAAQAYLSGAGRHAGRFLLEKINKRLSWKTALRKQGRRGKGEV